MTHKVSREKGKQKMQDVKDTSQVFFIQCKQIAKHVIRHFVTNP